MTFITIDEVLRESTLSRSSIYARMKKGTFPHTFRIGRRSVRWVKEEVIRWKDQQIKKRN